MLQSRHAHANQVALVAVVTLTLFAVRASVAKDFVAFTNDGICAVALGAARSLQVSALLVNRALLVAIEEVRASFVDAAPAHALEAERAHV